MKFFYEILSLTFLTVSAVIGAGFLSGREIVAFFGVNSFLPFLAVSFFIMALCFYICYYAGAKEKSVSELNARLFPAYKCVNAAVLTASFISAAGSVAGLSSLFYTLTGIKIPLFSVLSLVAASLVAKRGIKGVERISLILTPILVITVVTLIFLSGKTDCSVSASGTANALLSLSKTFLYAFMNCFINLPALVDGARGKSKAAHRISAVLSALFISALGIVIAAAIKGARTENSDTPLLFAVGKNPFFFLSLTFALLTSLFSAYYPLYSVAKRGKNAGKIALFAAVFALSLFGVKGIIDGLYPVIGALGAVYIIRCVIFLRRRYKKLSYVHNSCKKER